MLLFQRWKPCKFSLISLVLLDGIDAVIMTNSSGKFLSKLFFDWIPFYGYGLPHRTCPVGALCNITSAMKLILI
ncbi:hypothetical protein FGIG_10486 [Fasciola gigantica]|uniref:Uncharacterized protein n=1 Tax=Fasciola gigantica TaxID=46835 RepID=A0A504Z7V2_FASGI|nr:hypothetical protein FGIG_10486 [Fasciola gigantica]